MRKERDDMFIKTVKLEARYIITNFKFMGILIYKKIVQRR